MHSGREAKCANGKRRHGGKKSPNAGAGKGGKKTEKEKPQRNRKKEVPKKAKKDKRTEEKKMRNAKGEETVHRKKNRAKKNKMKKENKKQNVKQDEKIKKGKKKEKHQKRTEPKTGKKKLNLKKPKKEDEQRTGPALLSHRPARRRQNKGAGASLVRAAVNWYQHLIVSLAACHVLNVALGQPWTAPAFAASVLGALLPDVDHEKTRIFHFALAAVFSLVFASAYVTLNAPQEQKILASTAAGLTCAGALFLLKPRHRGITHHPLAAAVFGGAVFLFSRNGAAALDGALAYLSHLAADRLP